MHSFNTTLWKNYARAVRSAAILVVAHFLIVSSSTAQQIAGPEANTLQRMNCPTAGTIRADNGNCVSVESYFLTGLNTMYWVSQATGNDSNPGTKTKPWKTISRSTGVGVLKPGDVVMIRGGIYREAIHAQEAGKREQRITFAEYPGENVIVSGADPMNSGWTQSGNAWRHTWTTPLPGVPNNGTISQKPEFRRELLVADGKVLKPVYSRSDVVPGTFYVEGSDVAPKAIYMRLPGDDTPDGHNIEVGRRSALFLPKGAREDWCGAHYGWYRLVGLTFRHAVNNANWDAVCSGYEGSLLEENTVEWTNGTGIDVQGHNNTLRGNRVNDNGMRGIGGRCTDCLIEYNETSRNNWKKYPYSYSSSGIKLIYSNRTVINFHLSKDNDGTGIWLDVDNADNVIQNSVIIGSTARGILLEYGTVRTLVKNNVIYGTKKLSTNEASGIQSQAANSNVIVHNTIVGNEGHGIFIRSDGRFDDGYNKIYNNLLINNGTDGGVAVAEIRIDGRTVNEVRTTVLNGNLYWSHQEGDGNVFFSKTADGNTHQGNSLSEWQSMIGSDGGSGILSKTLAQVTNLSSPDGWHLVSTSQAIGRSKALPSGVQVAFDLDGDERTPPADVGADQYDEEIIDLPEPTGTIGESGTRTVTQSGSGDWHLVTLINSYADPVVNMSPVSYDGGQPAVVRVRNVMSKSFEFQIDEWDYLDGAHTSETVHYVVFEEGRHVLASGIELEAGHVTANSVRSRVTFGKAFGGKPVVFSQVVTVNDPAAVGTRQHNVTTAGFDLEIEGEGADPKHGNERVAYLALVEGSGSLGSRAFAARITARDVETSFKAIPFGRTFSSPPVYLAAMQSTYGGDTATLRYRNLSGSSAEVKVEEEQSDDSETTHTTEVVGFLALEAGTIPGTELGDEGVPAFLEVGGRVVMEAESFDARISRNGKSWDLQARSGSVGSVMVPGPVTNTNVNNNFATLSPELQYNVAFTSGGTYYVWGRALGPDGSKDSWHVGLDGQPVASADHMSIGDKFNSFEWTSLTMDWNAASIKIPAPGVYTINVWMREDGVFLDRLLLTRDANYQPSGAGPAESVRTNSTLSKSGMASTGTELEDDVDDRPQAFELVGNYPNPFNPATTIRYDLPNQVHVKLEVFDALGRRVALLVDDVQQAGEHGVTFRADGLASGVYVYRIQAGQFAKVSQMILMK